MLNPSTADERKLDPSCTRARNFAEAWGYGGLVVTNVFGWRATDPEAILGLVRSGFDRITTRELHRLRMSPGDAQIVRDNLADLHLPPAVEVVADGTLAPGSAIFETTRGELDVSAQTQFEEIERGLTDLIVRHRR